MAGGETAIAGLLTALAFAMGLGLGERMEHGIRTAHIVLALADRLGLPAADEEAVYYGALLKDAGCTACAPAFGTFFPDQLFARADKKVWTPRAWVRSSPG